VKKKKFEIEITEILSRVVDIVAESRIDAISRIHEKYIKTEIVLDYNDFIEVSFIDINTESNNDLKRILTLEIIDYLYDIEKKHLEGSNSNEKYNILSKIEKLKFLCQE